MILLFLSNSSPFQLIRKGKDEEANCDPPQEFDAKGESTRTTRLHNTLSVP